MLTSIISFYKIIQINVTEASLSWNDKSPPRHGVLSTAKPFLFFLHIQK